MLTAEQQIRDNAMQAANFLEHDCSQPVLAQYVRAALASIDELQRDRRELIMLAQSTLHLLKPGVTQAHRNIGRNMLEGNLAAIIGDTANSGEVDHAN